MSNIEAAVQSLPLDADELDWKEVKALGLEPAPDGMEQDETDTAE